MTGGFGFLGSHVVDELVKNPQTHVEVVDNLVTSPLNLEKYISHLGNPSNLSYSICSVSQYVNELSNESFDQIYHLASVVGPAGVLPHGGRIARSIIDDAQSILELALSCGARLVDVSTSEIYGGGKEGLCVEDAPKIVPGETSIRLEYAVGKLASEVALANMCVVHGLNAVIVRPFNISGPRQSGRGGFVLPRFISQALKGEPLTVFGDGKQVRAFTHVQDMADGLIKAMQHGCSGEAYNIGNSANRTTILELAERVIRKLDSSSEISFVDPKTLYGPLYAEAHDKYPDASKAMRQLGWQPQFSIEDTVVDAHEEMATNRVTD